MRLVKSTKESDPPKAISMTLERSAELKMGHIKLHRIRPPKRIKITCLMFDSDKGIENEEMDLLILKYFSIIKPEEVSASFSILAIAILLDK